MCPPNKTCDWQKFDPAQSPVVIGAINNYTKIYLDNKCNK